MVNPDELVDAVRDKLRLIPEVVGMVESADRISSYEDDARGLSFAVNEMLTPSILVAWMGNENSGDQYSASWVHTLSIFLRLGEQRLGKAFANICGSVATGDSEKFTEAEFHSAFEMLDVPTLVRDQDDDGIEYPRIEMRFRQRSND